MTDDIITAFRERLPAGHNLRVLFSNCTGPAGTPQTFQAQGPLGPADTWLLTDGRRRSYVIKYAAFTNPPEVIKETPGFQRSARDVVTCHVDHDGRDIEVIGILTSGGPRP